jgi:hypothetical protein
MRAISTNKAAELEFVKFDAMLKTNTVEFADKMSGKYKDLGLFALVMCQGGIANGSPRKETSEGHEWYHPFGGKGN